MQIVTERLLVSKNVVLIAQTNPCGSSLQGMYTAREGKQITLTAAAQQKPEPEANDNTQSVLFPYTCIFACRSCPIFVFYVGTVIHKKT